MLSTIKYFISASLIFLAAFFAQGQEKKPPKAKKNYIPTGLRVGTDLIDIGKTVSSNTFTGWEVNGDVDFANYYLAADVGSWGKDIALANGDYHNSGTYYRVGIDVNLLGKDPDKNMFFLGFRAGHSSFNESVTYHTTPSHLFSPLDTTLTNPSATGNWAELTNGLRVKIWKGLWLGYTARMKFAPTTHGSPNFATYDLPGYGVVQKSLWWGFNYQVFWRFAWKKDKVLLEKK
jgi:hypothetical protein